MYSVGMVKHMYTAIIIVRDCPVITMQSVNETGQHDRSTLNIYGVGILSRIQNRPLNIVLMSQETKNKQKTMQNGFL